MAISDSGSLPSHNERRTPMGLPYPYFALRRMKSLWVETTLEERFTRKLPEKRIGDRAYDSDPLDETLASQEIEMIFSHRKNRKKPATQDGRKLRRDKF